MKDPYLLKALAKVTAKSCRNAENVSLSASYCAISNEWPFCLLHGPLTIYRLIFSTKDLATDLLLYCARIACS